MSSYSRLLCTGRHSRHVVIRDKTWNLLAVVLWEMRSVYKKNPVVYLVLTMHNYTTRVRARTS